MEEPREVEGWLADAEILEFCKAGFLKLDGVVPAGADVLQSLIERYSHVQCPRDCSSARAMRGKRPH